jgi:predicted helicase
LLQSGLIDVKDLERKYKDELHANEIVLLAYYIAAINIENAYHDATPDPDDGVGKANYTSFDGIVLTDTFQLSETREGEIQYEEMLKKNSDRVEKQRKAPLRIIIGNPPYSVGQKSANDDAQNQDYPKLDKRIADTYAKLTEATNKNSLYDSYIKAFRWSTDRLDKTGGIICFVSNGAWLDGNSADGLRKSFEKEFSSIYILNLRGNQRTSGELSRKEGGKIFGSGSRTPISITLLVKNPEVKTEKATIHYHDIGDYLDRDQKLKQVKDFKTFANPKLELKTLQPNEHGDWISERNDAFGNYFPLGDKNNKKNKETFFVPNFSNGLSTARDGWCYNSSTNQLISNIIKTISFFNDEVDRVWSSMPGNISKQNELVKEIRKRVNYDNQQFSWSDNPILDISRKKKYNFEMSSVWTGTYRPFNKQKVYFNRDLNERVYQLPKLFPVVSTSNLVICIPGIGETKGFSSIISNYLPNKHLLAGMQCFPLFYYEENNATQKGLFDVDESQKYIRRDAISDFILERAKQQYGKTVTKEDIFYYVYGFLHSNEYRETFSNDLKKMLPRLPLVGNVKDFWAFSKAGRQLAELHLDYESVPPLDSIVVNGAEKLSFIDAEPKDTKKFLVSKMKFPQKGKKDSIIYNSAISISNIPNKAYEYVVNGKSAIEWIMERYQITTHKESGITNDPNDWAKEVGNPRYILDLLLSIINVSVQTVDIVNTLPKVDFGTEPASGKVMKLYESNQGESYVQAAEPDEE